MRVSRLIRLFVFLQACQAIAGQTITNSSGPSLSFQVLSGGNNNNFFRDNSTSAQLLLTSENSTSTARRLVVALPAGNSGALVYFLPSNQVAGGNSTNTLGVNLVNGSFTSATAEFSNVGVQADLVFDANATLGVTIIGAVRAMRGSCPSPHPIEVQRE